MRSTYVDFQARVLAPGESPGIGSWRFDLKVLSDAQSFSLPTALHCVGPTTAPIAPVDSTGAKMAHESRRIIPNPPTRFLERIWPALFESSPSFRGGKVAGAAMVDGYRQLRRELLFRHGVADYYEPAKSALDESFAKTMRVTLRMLIATRILTLIPAALLLLPSISRGAEQLTYRGSFAPVKTESGEDARKTFEIQVIQSDGDGAQIQAWVLSETGRGAWPWTDRFGVSKATSIHMSPVPNKIF